MRLTFLMAFICSALAAHAQFELDVEEDARIGGTLRVDNEMTISGRLEFPNFSVYIGNQSRNNDDNSLFNTFVGYRTGRVTTRGDNTFIGSYSGDSNVDGTRNTFVGHRSGDDNVDGDDNTFIGYSAGRENISGSDNTMVGERAGFDNTEGVLNAYFGALAGSGGTIGNRNTSIGSWSGRNLDADFGNTLLGFDADKLSSEDTLERAIAIGYNAKVGCSNCAVIGGTGTDAVKVGIGINQGLEAQLSLQSASSTDSTHISLLEEAANGYARIRFENAGQAGFWVLASRGALASGPRMNFFYNDGNGSGSNVMSVNGAHSNVGIGTANPDSNYKLDVNGDIRVNNLMQSSDRRYKKNIESITKPIELLSAIRGVNYEFKRDEFQEMSFAPGRHYGIIAQEIEAVLPELVSDQDSGYKAVNYAGLVPLLVEGIKEQQSEIEDLRKMMQQKESRIDQLSALVEKLLEREMKSSEGVSGHEGKHRSQHLSESVSPD